MRLTSSSTYALPFAALAIAAAGCLNSVGVTCPDNTDNCNFPDFASADLSMADLAGSPDLARDRAMDLASTDLVEPVRDMALADLVEPARDMALADLTVPDLIMPDFVMPDLSKPDLATPDLVMADLSHRPDLAAPTDLSTPPDLLRDTKDFMAVFDLIAVVDASVPDLSVTDDFGVTTRDLNAIPLDGPATVDASTAACLQTCSGGCCLLGVCVSGLGLSACGRGGGLCLDCSVLGDACDSNGECRCGSSRACDPGQVCSNGQCLCNSLSCVDGCCDSGSGKCIKLADQDKSKCGTAGLTCRQCLSTCALGVCL